MVTRYNRSMNEGKGYIMDESDTGVWVKHEDYVKLEAELARRDSQEPVAVVESSNFITTGQVTGEEPRRKAVRELHEGALVVGQKLYAAPPAAALPPEITPDDVKAFDIAVDDIGDFVAGANWMRRAAIVLGCQPVKEFALKYRTEGVHFVANRLLAAWAHGFIEEEENKIFDICRSVLSLLEFIENADDMEFNRDYADEMLAAIAKSM